MPECLPAQNARLRSHVSTCMVTTGRGECVDWWVLSVGHVLSNLSSIRGSSKGFVFYAVLKYISSYDGGRLYAENKPVHQRKLAGCCKIFPGLKSITTSMMNTQRVATVASGNRKWQPSNDLHPCVKNWIRTEWNWQRVRSLFTHCRNVVNVFFSVSVL